MHQRQTIFGTAATGLGLLCATDLVRAAYFVLPPGLIWTYLLTAVPHLSTFVLCLCGI